jgi:hypothetical protein
VPVYFVRLSSGNQSACVIHYGNDRHTRPRMARWNRLDADELEIHLASGEKLHGQTR